MDYEITDSTLVDDICGLYFNSDINTVYHFEKRSGHLYVKIGDNIPVRVIVVSNNLLSFYGFKAWLERDKSEKGTGMNITCQKFSRNNKFKKLCER